MNRRSFVALITGLHHCLKRAQKALAVFRIHGVTVSGAASVIGNSPTNDGWVAGEPLKEGDIIRIAGIYQVNPVRRETANVADS